MNDSKKLNNKKSTIYIICGQIGAGKTTFAKKLEKETNAIRFTPDEWMISLYDSIPENKKFDEYYYRCCNAAWEVAKKIASKGIDVVLDFGFWKKCDRNLYKKKIAKIGAVHKLFHVSTKLEIIKHRLKKRNESPSFGEIIITEEMFDFFSPQFEPPSAEEDAEVVTTAYSSKKDK